MNKHPKEIEYERWLEDNRVRCEVLLRKIWESPTVLATGFDTRFFSQEDPQKELEERRAREPVVQRCLDDLRRLRRAEEEAAAKAALED